MDGQIDWNLFNVIASALLQHSAGVRQHQRLSMNDSDEYQFNSC